MDDPQDSPSAQLFYALTRLADRPLEDGLPGDNAQVESTPTQRHFGFCIGNCHCAAPASVFCELLVNPDIAPLPNAPGLMRGLCNVRGTLVPVFSLQELTGDSPQGNRVLLLGRQQQALGLLVDSLPVSLDLPITPDIEALTDTDQEPNRPELDSLFADTRQHQGIAWHRIDPQQLGQALLSLCEQRRAG